MDTVQKGQVMTATETVSAKIARFGAALEAQAIPETVRTRAKLLMLDAIGTALASGRFPFARAALDALSTLGAGESLVIGMQAQLALRDAVMMNGILVHGLDYDDTYLPGSVHLTASCVPVALAMGAHSGASGNAVLTACILGLEIDARLAAAANGAFVRAGFHATSIAGTFAASLVAGKLMGLSEQQLVMAQGIALSTASGNLQPMQDGSWTKRMHPGWAGGCGITAAAYARSGYVGPAEAYEGKFGLYPCFLGAHAGDADLGAVTRELGERWEFPRTSVKLFPACHQIHAFLNAAIGLARERKLSAQDVRSVKARVTEAAIPLICEPAQGKRRPRSSYAAQFSLHYAIACGLLRGRYGLQEIEEAAYTDPELLGVADKVSYEIDPNSGFPKFRSGEVIVTLTNGETISRRENILPDEPAPAEQIVGKFLQNAQARMSGDEARRVADLVLDLDRLDTLAPLTQALR